MKHDEFLVPPGKKIALENFNPAFTGKFQEKVDAEAKLVKDIEQLAACQDILYARHTYAVLIIVQAMDAAGKDSVVKHVMSGVNPQGCQVVSFKEPSTEELNHDFLWRCVKVLPERGRIGIFNRSYYEEVLTVRIHPELLEKQNLPARASDKKIWNNRFEDINWFERYLVRNGIVILKFFLNVSKGEQKKRFLDRLDRSDKNWKFSEHDIEERAFWEMYTKAYNDVFNHTSTAWAPWYIIPADHKWFTRVAVADIILQKLKDLNLSYPVAQKDQKERIAGARKKLEEEP